MRSFSHILIFILLYIYFFRRYSITVNSKENALAAQRDLEKIYNFREHSPGIVNEYGSDFAAISYGNSVQWYEMIGDRTSALKQIEFVVRKMVPKFPPIAVHDLFSVLFPISMVMKDLGFGREAKDLLKKYVLERFSTLGLSSSTFWSVNSFFFFLCSSV